MGISAIAGTALSGMMAQTARLSVVADNVANAGTAGYRRQDMQLVSQAPGVTAEIGEGGPIDLATEMLELSEAELAYKANAAIFEAVRTSGMFLPSSSGID